MSKHRSVIIAFAVYSAVVTLLSLPILVWHEQRTGIALTIPIVTLIVAAVVTVIPGIVLAVLLDRGNEFARRYWWFFPMFAFIPQLGIIGFVFLLPLYFWLYNNLRSG